MCVCVRSVSSFVRHTSLEKSFYMYIALINININFVVSHSTSKLPNKFPRQRWGRSLPCCPQGLGCYRAIARFQPSLFYKTVLYFVNINGVQLQAAQLHYRYMQIFEFFWKMYISIDISVQDQFIFIYSNR